MSTFSCQYFFSVEHKAVHGTSGAKRKKMNCNVFIKNSKTFKIRVRNMASFIIFLSHTDTALFTLLYCSLLLGYRVLFFFEPLFLWSNPSSTEKSVKRQGKKNSNLRKPLENKNKNTSLDSLRSLGGVEHLALTHPHISGQSLHWDIFLGTQKKGLSRENFLC